MLILFKSDASADVITLEKNGKELLAAMGKDPESPQGIVTVAQLPEVIAQLRTAIKGDVQVRRGTEQPENLEQERVVSFSQRGQPVLELLERSLAEQVPVIWQG